METLMSDEINDYLSGKRLYGNDFTQDEINDWYIDESEGYANLVVKKNNSYIYEYHKLNYFHAFRFLKKRNFKRALGIGSAYGDEFTPIAKGIGHITILDPSDAFSENKNIAGTPCTYMKPERSGRLIFEANTFDLITSFGALHHIPNVSYVLSECYRCLKPDGVMLIREPISSMGDWRFGRNGLTKRERGIPVSIFDDIITETHFRVVKKTLCDFAPLQKVFNRIGVCVHDNAILTFGDAILSRIFSFNLQYHRISLRSKIAPGSVFYLLSK